MKTRPFLSYKRKDKTKVVALKNELRVHGAGGAAQPTRSTCVSRSAFEKPRSRERNSRTSSPSRISPSPSRRSATALAIVVLPEHGRPVSQMVTPRIRHAPG